MVTSCLIQDKITKEKKIQILAFNLWYLKIYFLSRNFMTMKSNNFK